MITISGKENQPRKRENLILIKRMDEISINGIMKMLQQYCDVLFLSFWLPDLFLSLSLSFALLSLSLSLSLSLIWKNAREYVVGWCHILIRNRKYRN